MQAAVRLPILSLTKMTGAREKYPYCICGTKGEAAMSNGLSEAQLAELRNRLESDKADLDDRLGANDSFGMHESMRDSIVELSAYDNHPGDLGTEMFERGKDLALNGQAMRQLRDSERALSEMADGSYGVCLSCGKPIPFERLQALPTAQYCIDHAIERVVSDDRPVEEEILAPPFGRTSLDELPEQNQFDGEDAWQIVQQWGNSNTPAMSENRDVGGYDEMVIENEELDDGFVEPIESFLATDIYGTERSFVRNGQYRKYMERGEGVELDELAETEAES
jgi:YteA family regulatory protein